MAVNVLSYDFIILLAAAGFLITWRLPKFRYSTVKQVHAKSKAVEATASNAIVFLLLLVYVLMYSYFPKNFWHSLYRPNETAAALGFIMNAFPVFAMLLLLGDRLGSVRVGRANLVYSMVLGIVVSSVVLVATEFFSPVFVSRLTHGDFLLFGTLVLGTFGEEILFRGFVQTRMEALIGGRYGLLYTAIVFALWHYPVWTMINGDTTTLFVARSILSLPECILLGYIAQKSGNLLGSTIVHSAFELPILLLS